MFQKHIRHAIESTSHTTGVFPACGQSLAPDLAKVSESVAYYFSQKRPGWKHETVPPATPLQPAQPDRHSLLVVEKCLMAELSSTRSQEQLCGPVKLATTVAVASAAREGGNCAKEQSHPYGRREWLIWRGRGGIHKGIHVLARW